MPLKGTAAKRRGSSHARGTASSIGEEGIQVSPRSITARKVANFVIRKITGLRYERRKFYVVELLLGARSERYSDPVYHVEMVSEVDELNALLEEREAWFRGAAARRFMEGALCFVVKADGKVISCLFATVSDFHFPVHVHPHVEYHIPIDNGTVGIFDAYTLPEYRGIHAYSAAFSACMKYFTEAGFTRAWVVIAADDVRSLTVHQRLGMDRIVTLVKSVRFLGVTKHSVRSTDRPVEEVL